MLCQAKMMHTNMFLLLLFSLSSEFTSAANGVVMILPQNGTKVIYRRKYLVAGDFVNEPFTINSDVPVALLRYTDKTFSGGNEVIGKDEMLVFIKTSCPGYDWSITAGENQNGQVNALTIEANPNNDTLDTLPRSDLNATWTYTSRCTGNGVRRMKDTKPNVFIKPDLNDSLTSETSDTCGTLVEFMYDGCQRPVNVNSPRLRVSNVNLRSVTSYDTDVRCTQRYEAKIRPEKTYLRNTNTTVYAKQLTGLKCQRYVEGRPYIDSDGHQLQAESLKSEDACWADHKHDEFSKHDKTENYDEDEEIKSTWIKRSLGEHSSIASFAAVTISLMTNNAPPDLVRDSLRAALDEVEHATTSFKVASLLSGEIIEPGPLPPSSHNFETDIYGLMTRTFDEGCIDETLSAVVAAAEADSYASSIKETDIKLLMPELSKIARDEARHAALAFRTIHWGCGHDPQWCQENIANYFALSPLEDHVKNRFRVSSVDKVQMKLEYLYDSLIEFVTRTNSASAEELCEYHASTFGRKEVGVVGEVVDAIVREVLCGSDTTVIEEQ